MLTFQNFKMPQNIKMPLIQLLLLKNYQILKHLFVCKSIHLRIFHSFEQVKFAFGKNYGALQNRDYIDEKLLKYLSLNRHLGIIFVAISKIYPKKSKIRKFFISFNRQHAINLWIRNSNYISCFLSTNSFVDRHIADWWQQ